MKLTGNTFLITGGTSGIGRAFAEKFVELGNTVIICARREERLQSVKEKHPSIITKVCDVANSKDREELAAWVNVNYPGTNVLINNAGIQLRLDFTKPVDLDMVREEMETNLIAPVHLSNLFTPILSRNENAAIINISSGLAFAPLALVPVYCATKAALHSFTMSLRYQLRNTGIKVYEVIPPQVDTDLGYQDRPEKNTTHGGLAIADFLKEAIEGLENDLAEPTIGQSKFLKEKRESFFTNMNP